MPFLPEEREAGGSSSVTPTEAEAADSASLGLPQAEVALGRAQASITWNLTRDILNHINMCIFLQVPLNHMAAEQAR